MCQATAEVWGSPISVCKAFRAYLLSFIQNLMGNSIQKLMGNSASQIGYLSTQTCILKLDCPCKKCQRYVLRVLVKIDGVDSVSLKCGEHVTVIGTLASVDVFLKTLKKDCRKKNKCKTQIQRREQNSGEDVGGDKKEDTVIAQRDKQRNEDKTQNQHGEQNSGRDVRDHKEGARREMQREKPNDPKQQTQQKPGNDGAGNAGNDGCGNANDNAAVAQGKMQNKTLKTQKEQNSDRHEDNVQLEEDLLSTGRQKVFKIEDLEAATHNFHEDNKVGKGGFGAVYKGTTDDGKQIAVKKMSFTNERSREFMTKQFDNEKLLAEVQHLNLVNLLGYCEQGSERFLVYEYLPNESLDKFLFDPKERKRLDWHKRSNIILGIARGLLYLHQDSRVRIVHRDIKATNILLDDELNPQIADFGTAKIFPEDKTHVIATSVVGTFGYMPPEYVMWRQISLRNDVYSFGILLLEILTGEEISADALNSLGRVWRLYNTKEALQTIDRTIIETWDIETRDKEATKALRCIQVGLLCIQGDSRLRPTMAEVINMLSTDMSLKDPENPPCLPSYCATQENGNSAMEKLMFNSE